MIPIFALTGGIATGKSTVARRLVERGATVVDADRVARDVVAPGTEGLRAVCEAFGDSVLTPDGGLDRAALGRRVFGDDDARRLLESILHPRIARESLTRLAAAAARGVPPVVYDAALLVEQGRHRDFAGLIVVVCSEEHQLARVIARDGLSEDEARARIAAQLPLAEKAAVADWLIENDGTLEQLTARVDEVFDALVAQSTSNPAS